MNAAALRGFSVEAFERGEIYPDTFDHEAHVYVAWLYLERFPLPAAVEKFDAALRRLTVKLGVPGKYHATITGFYLLLIAERRSVDPGADWHRFRRQNADLIEDGGVLGRYYSSQTLASDRARRAFVLPDRFMDKRGPIVKPDPNKRRITIRLDGDIIEHFKSKVLNAGGGNYQTLINNALRRHIQEEARPLEENLRRVIHEQLSNVE